MPEDTDVEFRSEVEGAMHACGHDAHTAMLAGAARLLHGRRDAFAGTVRFMFQPGEEGFHGARAMIDEGVLADPAVDGAFALHITPNIPSGMVATRPGPIMASDDLVSIELRGRGGHASTPHLGNDPIPVACEIVQALQTFVTRRLDAFDPAVLTITKIRAGTTSNVVPEEARMLGTLRTVSEGTRARAREGIERVATGIAAAHEMTATLDMVPGYPVTVNDPGFARFAAEAATGLLGEGRVFEMPSPVMGAEDFSYVLQQVRGAVAFLGVCPPGADPARAPGCHSNRMVLDEDAMAVGVALHAKIALDFLAGG
jgi:hippurate hydrolase